MADDEKQPIDGEFGLDYQLFIFRKMINELPDSLRQLIGDQLDEVTKAMAVRNVLIKDAVLKDLEDVRLNVMYVEFDNQALQRERDELQRRLDKLL